MACHHLSVLKACVNGPRTPGEHSRVPVSADQIAADVVRVVAAGADAVHLHVKDDTGADTLQGAALAAVLRAVRAAAPGTPVGVTTGAWAEPEPTERLARIEAWTVLPDFASVNWHEDGAEQVAELLLGRGVGVEAGLWTVAAARSWSDSVLNRRCLRVLLELSDGLDATGTEREADDLLAAVAGTDLPVLLHGLGPSCWPALRHAVAKGLDTRIGLEDVLVLPDGAPAPDHAALVAAARELGAG